MVDSRLQHPARANAWCRAALHVFRLAQERHRCSVPATRIHHYSFGVVFTSYALDFKHIEGAVQETASIKRHWQRASSIAGGSTRDPSSGGKRISLSPMPIYLFKRSDECTWALMITVTSLQSGKAAKTPYRHLFSTDSSPDSPPVLGIVETGRVSWSAWRRQRCLLM